MESEIVEIPVAMKVNLPANEVRNPIKDGSLPLSNLDDGAEIIRLPILAVYSAPNDADMAIRVNETSEVGCILI